MDEELRPFSTYRAQVRSEWVDYNGHMHDASYAIALSEANEELLAVFGLSADYRAAAGAALYTVEYHIRYVAECSLGQSLRAETTMLAADERSVQLYTELLLPDGRVAATGESLYLHVDTTLGAVTAMPWDRLERVQDMRAAHAGLPRPAHLGLGVGAARSSRGAT
jgi:acyl-CoA thioester hydrolase